MYSRGEGRVHVAKKWREGRKEKWKEGRDFGKGEFKGKVGRIRRGGREEGAEEGVGKKGSRRSREVEWRMGEGRWRKEL
jgi:hypothetical protein